MQVWLVFLGIFLLLSLLVILFFVSPSFANRSKIRSLKSCYFANRGLHSKDIVENSLKAFERAVSENYGVKFEVRLTDDANIVVFSEDSVIDAFGIDKPIEAFPYYQIKKLGLFNTEETVPLLAEVLDSINGAVPIIIEIKSTPTWEILCKKLGFWMDKYEGDFLVQSFDPIIVDWFKLNRPNYLRGLMMYPYKKGDNGINGIDAFFTRNMFANIIARPHYIAYDCNDRNKIGLKLMTKIFKLPEVSFTVKDEDMMKKCVLDDCIIIFENFVPKENDSVEIIEQIDLPKEEIEQISSKEIVVLEKEEIDLENQEK